VYVEVPLRIVCCVVRGLWFGCGACGRGDEGVVEEGMRYQEVVERKSRRRRIYGVGLRWIGGINGKEDYDHTFQLGLKNYQSNEPELGWTDGDGDGDMRRS
jgi:hypothetical protein